MKYVVELNDDDGKSFQVEMHLPWAETLTNPGNSSWKTLDKGFIKYHSGGCSSQNDPWFKPVNIRLVTNGLYGVEFFGFFDGLGIVNSSGKGEAQQNWAVGFKPGGFGWALVS
jgi:hypothetical protein